MVLYTVVKSFHLESSLSGITRSIHCNKHCSNFRRFTERNISSFFQFLPFTSYVTSNKTMNNKLCAYCYVARPCGASVCGKWCKRVYCSCQCQGLDWKMGHKRWCSQSGEKDHDYCVCLSPGKGLGVFAMREFKAGEKTIVERPIIKCKTMDLVQRTLNDIPASARDAFIALEPSEDGASMTDKICRNMMSCNDQDGIAGLFINLSRVNHCCIGNCTHKYMEEFGVKILVANHDLSEGEEVTFTYATYDEQVEFPSRRAQLRAVWKFDCRCLACSDPNIDEKLNRIPHLDNEILQLVTLKRTDLALRKGRALIRIYDDLRLSPKLYQRTYYYMFQAAVAHPDTSQQGAGLARQAVFYATLFYGADHEDVKYYQALADNPKLHPDHHGFNWARYNWFMSLHRNYHCSI